MQLLKLLLKVMNVGVLEYYALIFLVLLKI